MSIENILKESADLEQANKSTLGIKRAYDETPENPRVFPHSIRYPVEWEYQYAKAGLKITIHRFNIEVRVCRGFLPQAEAQARPMIKKWLDLYATDAGMDLNGSCNVCTLLGGRYGKIEAGTETFMGIIFTAQAKETT